MTEALATSRMVGVIGAGTMGAGIAQVAAAAGHPVYLFDAMKGAADASKERICKGLNALVTRGKTSAGEAEMMLGRITPVARLEDFAGSDLVIEAIVEDLEVKRGLFGKLESIIAPGAVLASNTSSISITSIACQCRNPERVIGMHFFNPAPVMKLVEIVSGVATDPEIARKIFATAQAWGKVAVHAKSTPGFIVNRVARPYYAEALRLYEEQVSDPATLDALMTEGGGFPMGPFELMDLIGHDVNYAVSLSVFNAFYQEPRFRPSISQLELVNAGRLGRKTGRGFFDYAATSVKSQPASEEAAEGVSPLEGVGLTRNMTIEGIHIALTDGRTAHDVASAIGMPAILYDLTANGKASRTAFTTSRNVPSVIVARFVATLKAQGVATTRLPDWPALAVMRTVAMLANEAFEAVLQGVGNEADVDAAMRFGVNYPKGPIAWAREIGLSHVLAVVDNIHEQTRDPRYRASLGLRMAAHRG